jgi:hypothetical protein
MKKGIVQERHGGREGGWKYKRERTRSENYRVSESEIGGREGRNK